MICCLVHCFNVELQDTNPLIHDDYKNDEF